MNFCRINKEQTKDDVHIHFMDDFEHFLTPPLEQEEFEKTENKSCLGESFEENAHVGSIKRLCVRFNDAPIAEYIAKKLPKVWNLLEIAIYHLPGACASLKGLLINSGFLIN